MKDLADVFQEPEIEKYLLFFTNNFSRDNLPHCFLKLIEVSKYLLEKLLHLKQCHEDVSDHKNIPKSSKDDKEDQSIIGKKRRISLKTHDNHKTQSSIDDISSIMLQNIFSHFDYSRLLLNSSKINKTMQREVSNFFSQRPEFTPNFDFGHHDLGTISLLNALPNSVTNSVKNMKIRTSNTDFHFFKSESSRTAYFIYNSRLTIV